MATTDDYAMADDLVTDMGSSNGHEGGGGAMSRISSIPGTTFARSGTSSDASTSLTSVALSEVSWAPVFEAKDHATQPAGASPQPRPITPPLPTRGPLPPPRPQIRKRPAPPSKRPGRRAVLSHLASARQAYRAPNPSALGPEPRAASPFPSDVAMRRPGYSSSLRHSRECTHLDRNADLGFAAGDAVRKAHAQVATCVLCRIACAAAGKLHPRCPTPPREDAPQPGVPLTLMSRPIDGARVPILKSVYTVSVVPGRHPDAYSSSSCSSEEGSGDEGGTWWLSPPRPPISPEAPTALGPPKGLGSPPTAAHRDYPPPASPPPRAPPRKKPNAKSHSRGLGSVRAAVAALDATWALVAVHNDGATNITGDTAKFVADMANLSLLRPLRATAGGMPAAAGGGSDPDWTESEFADVTPAEVHLHYSTHMTVAPIGIPTHGALERVVAGALERRAVARGVMCVT